MGYSSGGDVQGNVPHADRSVATDVSGKVRKADRNAQAIRKLQAVLRVTRRRLVLASVQRQPDPKRIGPSTLPLWRVLGHLEFWTTRQELLELVPDRAAASNPEPGFDNERDSPH